MIRHPELMSPKSKTHTITTHSDGSCVVTSGTSNEEYNVRVRFVDNTMGRYVVVSCACDWGYYHSNSACSHTMAALRDLSIDEKGRTVSFWATTEDAKRQHRPIARVGVDGVWVTLRLHDKQKAMSSAEVLSRGRALLHDDYEI